MMRCKMDSSFFRFTRLFPGGGGFYPVVNAVADDMNERVVELIDNGFCLANPDEIYLIYLDQPGQVAIKLERGEYDVEWINAANMKDRRDGGTLLNGEFLIPPADAEDWLAFISKK